MIVMQSRHYPERLLFPTFLNNDVRRILQRSWFVLAAYVFKAPDGWTTNRLTNSRTSPIWYLFSWFLLYINSWWTSL